MFFKNLSSQKTCGSFWFFIIAKLYTAILYDSRPRINILKKSSNVLWKIEFWICATKNLDDFLWFRGSFPTGRIWYLNGQKICPGSFLWTQIWHYGLIFDVLQIPFLLALAFLTCLLFVLHFFDIFFSGGQFPMLPPFSFLNFKTLNLTPES